jgi:hypothetical protein
MGHSCDSYDAINQFSLRGQDLVKAAGVADGSRIRELKEMIADRRGLANDFPCNQIRRTQELIHLAW